MNDNEVREVFSKRLEDLLYEYRMTQHDLSKIVNVSDSTVGKWILKKATPRLSIIQQLSDYFHVPKSYFLEEDYLPKGAKLKMVPMLGYAAAGRPLEDLNQDVFYVNIENKYDVDFCITISGDSMTGAGIYDGDIVFIKKQETAFNGQIACVEIDNEKVCIKRFYKSDNAITLVSENPKYAPMIFTPDNCESVRILGVAVIKQSEIH